MKKSIQLFFICILTAQAHHSMSMQMTQKSPEHRPLPKIPSPSQPTLKTELSTQKSEKPYSTKRTRGIIKRLRSATRKKNDRPLPSTLFKNPTLSEVVDYYDQEKMLMHPNGIDYTQEQFIGALRLPQEDLEKHLAHYLLLRNKIIGKQKQNRSALSPFTPEKYNMYAVIYGSHASDTGDQEWTLKTLWSITTGANLHQEEHTPCTKLDLHTYTAMIKHKKSFILEELKIRDLI